MKKIFILSLILYCTTISTICYADSNISIKWVLEPTFEFQNIDIIDYRFDSIKRGYSTKEIYKYSIVEKDNKYGLIDYSGNYSINPQFDEKPELCICTSPEKFMVNNINYMIGIDGEALKVDYDLGHGIPDFHILNLENNQIGSLNEDTTITPLQTDELMIVEAAVPENNTIVRTNKFGLVNKKKLILEPKYDFIYNFHEDLAAVKLNNLWGFINKNGNEVIPCQYDYVGSFVNGLAPVKKNGMAGYINTTGECVTGMIYEEARPLNITNEYGWVKKNGKWGVIQIIGAFKNMTIENVSDIYINNDEILKLTGYIYMEDKAYILKLDKPIKIETSTSNSYVIEEVHVLDYTGLSEYLDKHIVVVGPVSEGFHISHKRKILLDGYYVEQI